MEHLKKLIELVGKELSCSAHDMGHTMRVYNLCLVLAKNEKINKEILLTAAILHDIGRTKEDKDYSGNTDHAIIGAEMAETILKSLNFSSDKIEKIKHCILTHRFRTKIAPQTLEAKILYDADKLDALGAIGIARSYVWVGENNAKIYTNVNLDEYIHENLNGSADGRIKDRRKHSPQIEYETKHKFLFKKLYTKQGGGIAKERLKFYKEFLNRLKKEINGKL